MAKKIKIKRHRTFEPTNKRHKLHPKQEVFIQEYMKDFDVKNASRRTGYRADTGYALLKRAPILESFQYELEKKIHGISIQSDDIILELINIAKSDIGEAFDEDGNLKPIHKIPENVRKAISGLEINQSHDMSFTKRVKMWDKLNALNLLGKHLGLWGDSREKNDVNIIIEERIVDPNTNEG